MRSTHSRRLVSLCSTEPLKHVAYLFCAARSHAYNVYIYIYTTWLGHILLLLHIVFEHVWNMLECFMLPMLPGANAEVWLLPGSKLWLESFQSRRISVVRSAGSALWADDQLTEKELLLSLKFEYLWTRNPKGFPYCFSDFLQKWAYNKHNWRLCDLTGKQWHSRGHKRPVRADSRLFGRVPSSLSTKCLQWSWAYMQGLQVWQLHTKGSDVRLWSARVLRKPTKTSRDVLQYLKQR